MAKEMFYEEALFNLAHTMRNEAMIPVYRHENGLGADISCEIVPENFALNDIKVWGTNRWRRFNQLKYDRLKRAENGDNEPFIVTGKKGENEYIQVIDDFKNICPLSSAQWQGIIDGHDTDTEVITLVDGLVCVHRDYLDQYLSMRNKVLMLQLEKTYDTSDFDVTLERIEVHFDTSYGYPFTWHLWGTIHENIWRLDCKTFYMPLQS
jgi:hypothetical protein